MRYAVMKSTVQQVRSAGGTNIKEARRTGIIFATLTEPQVAYLRARGCQVNQVEKVEPAVIPPTPVAGVPTYTPEQLFTLAGLEDLRGMTDPPLYGEGFNLAIVDTGIRETHEKIIGHIVYSENFTDSPMRDGFDHGTAVASVALAVAPSCGILNMKVLDDDGEGTEEEVVLAIDKCIDLWDTHPELAPLIINLSLGAPDDGNPNNTLRVVCRAAIREGIWISAAAGNGGPDPQTIMSPACEKYVLATGSVKYQPFAVSGFSSRGPTKEGIVKPDGLFFGEDIILASSSSNTATVAKSGTSFSAPFSSSLCLLYHESMLKYTGGVGFPGEVPPGMYQELGFISVEELVDTYLGAMCVKPEGTISGKDNDYGYGLPLGSLIAQIIRLQPAMGIDVLLNGIILVAMMGMMVKVMK